MARVQCLECGIAVVVDPTGLCPDGHLVGAAGARVEAGMGASGPHPDEPEPWVARVDLEEAPQRAPDAQRSIRPMQIVGTTSEPEAGDAEVADHESMLRELHALGELGGSAEDEPSRHGSAGAPATAASPDVRPGPPVGPAAPADPAPRSAPARASRDEVAEGFAELSALEAAVQAMGFEEELPSNRGGSPASVAGDDLEGFAELFGAESAPEYAPEAARGTESWEAPAEAPDGRVPPRPPPPPNAPPAADARATGPSGEPADGTSQLGTPAPPPAPPEAPAATEPQASAPTEASEPAPTRPADAPLDITNFTARGGKVGAGRGGARRKLFGR